MTIYFTKYVTGPSHINRPHHFPLDHCIKKHRVDTCAKERSVYAAELKYRPRWVDQVENGVR